MRTGIRRRRTLVLALSVVLAMAASAVAALYLAAGPILGKEPQEFADVYMTNPKNATVETWVENLEIPWSLVWLSDGRALVSERPGRIRLIEDGKLAEKPFAEIAVSTGGEGGLMGLALAPGYPETPLLYVMYTYSEGGERGNRVARYKLSENSLALDKVIIDHIPAGRYHDGGRIKFGPDGMLYVCTGETTVPELAQDKGSLAGKILRVTPDGDVPADNPFPGSSIWTYGNRNPQGIAWNETGIMFESEHGPSGEFGVTGKDEVNIIRKGANYGWPRVVCAAGIKEYIDPIACWDRATPPGGIAFCGGDLFVPTMRSEALLKITLKSDVGSYKPARIERWFAKSDFEGTYGRLRDVEVGPDGRLYVLTTNRDGRGTVRPGDDKILRITMAKPAK
jgi:glucose/arabinose dehydrogenase